MPLHDRGLAFPVSNILDTLGFGFSPHYSSAPTFIFWEFADLIVVAEQGQVV